MFGKNARSVVLNTDNIEKVEVSRGLYDEWSTAMKAAIQKDLTEEEHPESLWEKEALYRFGYACEEVIVDLLFCLKWSRREVKSLINAGHS